MITGAEVLLAMKLGNETSDLVTKVYGNVIYLP